MTQLENNPPSALVAEYIPELRRSRGTLMSDSVFGIGGGVNKITQPFVLPGPPVSVFDPTPRVFDCGASYQDDRYTVRVGYSYPISGSWVVELTAAVFQPEQKVADQGAGPYTPTTYTTDFWSDPWRLFKDNFDLFGPADAITPVVSTIVCQTTAAPSSPVYTLAHKKVAQIVVFQNTTTIVEKLSTEDVFTGFDSGTGLWEFENNQAAGGSTYHLASYPTYDTQGTAIIANTWIPDIRGVAELDLGWYESYGSVTVDMPRFATLCWNSTVSAPSVVASDAGSSTRVGIYWRPVTAPNLGGDTSGDKEDGDFLFGGTNFGFNLGSDILWDLPSPSLWTRGWYFDSDGSGDFNGTATVDTLPTVGDLVHICIIEFADRDGDLPNCTATYNFNPTKLPFAVMAPSGIVPGHG